MSVFFVVVATSAATVGEEQHNMKHCATHLQPECIHVNKLLWFCPRRHLNQATPLLPLLLLLALLLFLRNDTHTNFSFPSTISLNSCYEVIPFGTEGEPDIANATQQNNTRRAHKTRKKNKISFKINPLSALLSFCF
uniref:Uncharacterized protein n=1 Tax=Trypanosoma congolense (strain IL3000) TaxID=1068625 RepID=G0ULJ6_TRYCI|nr:hypothetical protein, unlikely [Trypanosoma congolense IL3000]